MPIKKEYLFRPAVKDKKGERGVEVTVPPEWCDYHNVKTGDKAKMFADGIVVILPPNITEKEEERVRNFLERKEDGE